MSTHDDDILDFDFFDETRLARTSRTERDAGRRRRPPRGGGGPRRPQLRAPHGLTPILRLVGLVAFAILIVVLLVVWAQGCSSDQQRDAYRSYMTDIGSIGNDSAKIGVDLAELLTTPGLEAGRSRDAAQRADPAAAAARHAGSEAGPAWPGERRARSRRRGAAAAGQRHARGCSTRSGDDGRRRIPRPPGKHLAEQGAAAARRATSSGGPLPGRRRRRR